MKNRNKALVLGIGAAALAYGGASEYYYNNVFKRDDSFYDDPLTFSYKGEALKEKQEERDRLLSWLSESNKSEGYIKSFDGLNLYGILIENNDTKSYVIMVHGMRNDHKALLKGAYEFSSLGYNVLLVDQRANGKSEGEYITYGFKESIDISQWIDMLCKRVPDCNICLYGVSMGASSIMCALRNDLPANVKCVVEDCGYTDACDEIKHVTKKYYNTPVEPLFSTVVAMANKRLGFNLSEASPINCLKDNEVPILFVHGTRDNYVPFDMAKMLYNANKGVKKFYPVNDKGHSTACDDPDYYQNINSFVGNYL